MSIGENRPEAERWLLAAEEDLRAANYLYQGGMYAQACLLAQQCGEKTIKALWHLRGAMPRGRSVERLVGEFPYLAEINGAETWLDWARQLDEISMAALSPRGLPGLSSTFNSLPHNAERGVDTAQKLLEASRDWLAGH